MIQCIRKLVVVSSLAIMVSPAFAENSACLMEGSFTMLGQTTQIKDCMESGDVAQEQFVETCEGISNAAVAFGAEPAKITYLAACPAGAQGSCKGLFGSPMTAYYYKRDAETLADTKKGCVAQGGEWH